MARKVGSGYVGCLQCLKLPDHPCLKGGCRLQAAGSSDLRCDHTCSPGHEDVKKALLLVLIGSYTKQMQDSDRPQGGGQFMMAMHPIINVWLVLGGSHNIHASIILYCASCWI